MSEKLKKIRFLNKYIIIAIIVLLVIITRTTYSFLAYSYSNRSVIKGNVIAVNATLDVERVVGTNEGMVPLKDSSLNNAINGVGSSNGACVDKYGNLSCQVYKITLTNTGSRLQSLKGTIKLEAKDSNSKYNNLGWRELTDTTTIKDGSVVNGMNESTLVSGLTMESKEVKVWYIAVYIREANGPQEDIDKGEFKGTVTFKTDNSQSISLGSYVKMTPTKSSYTTDTSKTGYPEAQTINPQELNLWRVISLNDDGTVEVVSEYVSSTSIYFEGQTGYQNLVGYLNVLASQYENSTYTKSSRHFGYNGQTEYITDTSKFTNPAPWTCSTGGSCNPVESQGGGDELYTKDYNLVKNVLGTTIASKPDGTAYYYWMASRYYNYSSTTNYIWNGWRVDTSGDVNYRNLYYYYSSRFYSYGDSRSLRPILTLKSGLKYSGNGTEDKPYVPSTN